MLMLGTPLGVCRVVFWFSKKWLGNGLIFVSPTVATKLHPIFSLTPPLAFFPAPFTPHCLHYLNTWNRLLSPILWWIWVSQLKRNEFKSGGCLYAPSPHALQKGKIVGNAIFNILGISETRLSWRFIVIVILWRIPKLGIKFVVLVSLSPLSLITVSLINY